MDEQKHKKRNKKHTNTNKTGKYKRKTEIDIHKQSQVLAV